MLQFTIGKWLEVVPTVKTPYQILPTGHALNNYLHKWEIINL